MTVRTKFVVQSITESAHWEKSKGNVKTVKLTPVTSGSEENKSFYAATPGGSIDLSTLNAEAAAQFEIGAEFYVDFNKA